MKRLLGGILVITTVVACGTDTSSEVTADAGTAPEEPLVPIATPSPEQPTVPIKLGYVIDGEPSVGEPLEVIVTAVTPLAGTFELAFATQAELALGANQPDSVDFGEQAADANTEHMTRVTVIPAAEGRAFLTVTATVPTADGAALRLLSVPIQTGAVPRKQSVTGTAGETSADAAAPASADDGS